MNGGGACLRIARVGKTRQGRVDEQKTRAPALPPSQGSWRPNGMSKTRWRWEVGWKASRLQGWQPADQGPGLKCQVIDWCYVAAVNIWSLQRSSACGREMERCRLRSRCVMRPKKKGDLLIEEACTGKLLLSELRIGRQEREGGRWRRGENEAGQVVEIEYDLGGFSLGRLRKENLS